MSRRLQDPTGIDPTVHMYFITICLGLSNFQKNFNYLTFYEFLRNKEPFNVQHNKFKFSILFLKAKASTLYNYT